MLVTATELYKRFECFGVSAALIAISKPAQAKTEESVRWKRTHAAVVPLSLYTFLYADHVMFLVLSMHDSMVKENCTNLCM